MTLATDHDRRLHPLSWLFLLLAQLRQFALPLVALLLFGRRGGNEWWQSLGAVGAVGVALLAVLQYYTYRFRIAGGELTIRSGLLQRNVRHIPLARIQNVVQRRSLLHRLAGVAEVRLESAAGQARAEAEMRVLSLADARALETLIRSSRADARADAASADDGSDPVSSDDTVEPLLTLPLAELVRLGLSSNRGMVVVAAGFGAAWQLGDGARRWFNETGHAVAGYARELHAGPASWLIGVLALVVAAALLLRLLSVGLVILRLYDFRLTEHGDRLGVEGGLLTRLRGHAARSRVQRWLLADNVWMRLMERRSVRVDTAAARSGNDPHALTELVPIAPVASVDALLARWLPQLPWTALDWRPLHPRAWRRMVRWPAVLTVLASGLLVSRVGAGGLFALALLPFWVWRARQLTRRSGWWADAVHLCWRTGWLDRQWQIVEIDRIQVVQLQQSPFDRRHRMAHLLLDTAGADPMRPPLRLFCLPETEARALAERLARQVAGT